MIKLVSPLVTIALAAAQPAIAGPSYGPPSAKSLPSQESNFTGLQTFSDGMEYPEPDNLLTANGVEIADGRARRPIAPNTEFAVERAHGLIDQFGDKKKPMRLLLRVGTRF